jgi:hypothetical protein
MREILNPMDIIKVGLMAFIFIFLANRGLNAVGLSNYQA